MAEPAPSLVPSRAQITGLVLAGGRGQRLGGVDKGRQVLNGQPLAALALQRLAPQVGSLMLSANRHLADYATLGVPVWPDEVADFPGPLAGFLAGLTHCETPWLLTVPCDTPHFPTDLAARLAQAAAEAQADVVLAASPNGPEPVFCLMRRTLEASLRAFVASGQRQVGRWARSERCAVATFPDAVAFFNANTPAELAQLRGDPA